jgi:hypothetical protein
MRVGESEFMARMKTAQALTNERLYRVPRIRREGNRDGEKSVAENKVG